MRGLFGEAFFGPAGGRVDVSNSSAILFGGGAPFVAKQPKVSYVVAFALTAALGGGVSGCVRDMIESCCPACAGGDAAGAGARRVGAVGGAPSAQELSATERAALLARKDALFQQMLRNPGNLDTAFAYADVSAKLGDNEAAVSALERMLLFNPNLPRVQLELGALYFRMGSYELSRTYFEGLAAANPPAEVKSRIETYLAEIERLSAPRRFSGFLLRRAVPVGRQPCAGLAAGAFAGRRRAAEHEFVKKADVNIFGTGSVLYSIDLGTQNRDTVEIPAPALPTITAASPGSTSASSKLTVGPRFNFTDPLPQVSAASLKPYAIANDVSLGGNQYFHTFGVGGEATAVAWNDVRLRSVFEFRNKNFNDAPDRPLSRGLTGSDKLFSLLRQQADHLGPLSELALEFDFLAQSTACPTVPGSS